jgi:hypothetical protein
MVKRRGLADMLRTEAQQLQQTPEETNSVSLEQTESQSLLGNQTGEGSSAQSGIPKADAVRAEATASTTPVAPDPADHRVTESVGSEGTESGISLESVSTGSAESVSLVDTDSVPIPRYLRLVRKEARLHEAQYDELTQLARELNRKKREAGEIITANTLLRVATELLLRRRSELQGNTEAELLTSLK